MHWFTMWILMANFVYSFTQSFSPTVCEDETCHCDSFTRVICNCSADYHEVVLRPDGAYRIPQLATAIIIDGCARVQFLPNAVASLLKLRHIQLLNVLSVDINERGLAWSPMNPQLETTPGIRIVIDNSTINEISSHAVQGRAEHIIISNSKLKQIRPFAFSSLRGVSNVELINNEFENIDIQVFKKFTITNFLLQGGVINILPSRFLSDMEVTNLFRMERVTVNQVSSLAFFVSLPQTVIVESNNIGVLEGDSLFMVTKGPIKFRNNTVKSLRKGAFSGLKAHSQVTSTKGRQQLIIDNNTVVDVMPTSLMYDQTTLSIHVDELNINSTCTCELAEEWRELTQELSSAFNCWYTLDGYFLSLSTFVDSRCGKFKQMYWIFVVIGIIIVLVVLGIVIFCIVRHESKKKERIVMPDGKTYRETEFHIIVEKAELLKTDL